MPYIVRPVGVISDWGFANRHPFLKPLSFALIEKHLLLRARAVHVTSSLERRTVERYLQGSKKPVVIPDFVPRVIVIPEPSELATDVNAGLSLSGSPDRTVLFMSRVDPKKGVDILIAAFQIVRQTVSDAQLLIVGPGDPEYVESLKQKVKAFGLDNCVTWRGFVGGAEKWAILRKASILALPSHAENFAVVVLEALSVNTPVVISDNVGLAETIAAAKAGVVTTTRPDEVAKGILSLLKDHELSARLSQNGRILIDEYFSQESVINKLRDMYEKALLS